MVAYKVLTKPHELGFASQDLLSDIARHAIPQLRAGNAPCPPQISAVRGTGSKGNITRFLSSTLLPFYFGASLLKPNTRKKGTLIIMGSLRNLDKGSIWAVWVPSMRT